MIFINGNGKNIIVIAAESESPNKSIHKLNNNVNIIGIIYKDTAKIHSFKFIIRYKLIY